MRKLAQELGFPPSFAATLSDVLRGKHGNVSLRAENQIRASLGLESVRLTRKRIRREMTPEQAVIWDGLSKEERDVVLGVRDESLLPNQLITTGIVLLAP